MADVEMKEASSSKAKTGSKVDGASDGKKKFEVKKVSLQLMKSGILIEPAT
jgi:hypothetical protein